MAAIVNTDLQTTRKVVTYRRSRSATEYLSANPEMIAAMRIAVPVADSQLSEKTAASGVGLGTTGGTRETILSRPAIGMFGEEMWLRKLLTCGVPHANTTRTSTIHGMRATRSGGAARSTSEATGGAGVSVRSNWPCRQ